MHAVKSNRYDTAVWLMDSMGLDCHEPHRVYFNDEIQIFLILYDLCLFYQNGKTILQMAVIHGSVKLVQLFQNRGCDILKLDSVSTKGIFLMYHVLIHVFRKETPC